MLQKLFGFDATQHKVRTEVYAGVTTFLTMAYVLAVNPGIFSARNLLGWHLVWASTLFLSLLSVWGWATAGSSR